MTLSTSCLYALLEGSGASSGFSFHMKPTAIGAPIDGYCPRPRGSPRIRFVLQLVVLSGRYDGEGSYSSIDYTKDISRF
jgi:hypothetical protein